MNAPTTALSLSCRSLSAGYETLTVVRDVDLDLASHEILAILGPNGAGKTTLLLTLAGFLPPIEGTIEVGGQPIKGGSARRMNKAGVVLVPDSRALFTQLSTLENLRISARPGAITPDDALDLFPALQKRVRLKVGMLSGGEQQMLAMARALVQGPKVLLIDEMSMGLAPVIVESLMPMVRSVADQAGASVVLVEQHVRLALEIADHALVLVHGEVRLHGSAAEVRSDTAKVEAAYLGAVEDPAH
jgi:branched-chain amino acid transport system ATP-binding protein